MTAPRPRTPWFATNCGAIRHCWASTRCWRRKFWWRTPESRPDLELIKNLIHNHTRRVARYRCDTCGFKARQFYWRCPGCGGWETYPPKRTEEFDIAP